jgi:hypothetical protein
LQLFKKRIVVGYLASVFVASLYVVLAIEIDSIGAPAPRDIVPPEELQPKSGLLFILFFAFLLALTILPSAGFILISELKIVRTIVPYLLFAVVLEYSLLSLPILLLSAEITPKDLIESLIMLPAGVLSGFVYWYFAGRYAGDDIADPRKQIDIFE